MTSSSSSIDPRLRDTAATPASIASGSPYPQQQHSHLMNASLPSSNLPLNPRLPPPSPHYQPLHHEGQSHQSSYPPHSPQPNEHTSAQHSPDDRSDGGDGGANDPKRPRACEACRGLKVRCEPDPQNADGPCKRCAKAKRQCLVTAPSRKRQKKTDSRVAELEKKIDALTASLHKKNSGAEPAGTGEETAHIQSGRNPYEQVTNGSYAVTFGGTIDDRRKSDWSGSNQYPKPPEHESRNAPPPMVMAGQKRKHVESRDYAIPAERQSSGPAGGPRGSLDGSHGNQPSGFAQSAGSQAAKSSRTHEYADVIDRDIITAETATHMFNHYVERMAPHMPVVIFPPGTTAAEIRKSKPTLFLAILSASSGLNHPEVQRMLTKEVMSIYANRIICNGEKTLELIQALHISTLWYWPPEHYEELKFYQLIHIAAVMAIDIGMGKRSKITKTKNAGLFRDTPWRRTPYPDPETIEARRAWLGCYWLCCNASMGLRRPNLIRWNSYMSDCCDVLENSPEAAVSDRFLCQWVRSQHIAEEVGTQFSMDDPTATVSIADSKVQYALRGFERDLEKWSSSVSMEVQTPTLKMTEHVICLYMHEVAMHVDHNVDEFKPPFTENSLRGSETEPVVLTPAHISALSICLTSIDGIFETFLKLEVDVIRCLPIANFIRIAYTVVVLIKMYFQASMPNSELGKVIDKDNMKVEQYLDGLIETFRATAANEKSRPAAKFLMVLLMMKTWFNRHREGKSVKSDNEVAVTMGTIRVDNSPQTDPSNQANQDTQNRQLRHSQHSSHGTMNTPLQLLSEVATGNSRGQVPAEAGGSQPPSTGQWTQQPQQAFDSYDPSTSQLPPGQGYDPNAGSKIDPALSMDIGYGMGDGFEQAMGMTLGDGQFEKYFSDDAFFGSLMDTMGGHGGVFEQQNQQY
ncbi:hypothetical protein PVAG01_04138 [Phlyctema vagabunda]|uniref:Zn(2)-C6 fungal-type domain-containing protein n=1 Tax=Phlyctema vagabunda TaxID=108571 RepID=A0ABR4PND3_9HELO